MHLDPVLRRDAAQRAQDALDRAADLRQQAVAQENRALLLGRTWELSVNANIGVVYMPSQSEPGAPGNDEPDERHDYDA